MLTEHKIAEGATRECDLRRLDGQLSYATSAVGGLRGRSCFSFLLLLRSRCRLILGSFGEEIWEIVWGLTQSLISFDSSRRADAGGLVRSCLHRVFGWHRRLQAGEKPAGLALSAFSFFPL